MAFVAIAVSLSIGLSIPVLNQSPTIYKIGSDCVDRNGEIDVKCQVQQAKANQERVNQAQQQNQRFTANDVINVPNDVWQQATEDTQYTSQTTTAIDPQPADDYIDLPGSCLPEKMSGKRCSEGQVCAQVTDSLYMCQNPNQANAQPCSKPWSQAEPNTKSLEQAYYSHNFSLDTEDECQVRAGVPTGWVVTKQVCKNGEWIDVEVKAPKNGVGTNNCPAIFNCEDYPEYCPKEEENSQLENKEISQVSKFLNFVKNLFSFKI